MATAPGENLCACRRDVASTGRRAACSSAAAAAEIALRPFSFTSAAAGRRLLRPAGVWVADGDGPRPVHPVHRGRDAREDCAGRAGAARAGRHAAATRSSSALALQRRPRGRGCDRAADDERSSWSSRPTGDPLRLGARLGPALGGAPRRARAAPQHAAGPGRPRRSSSAPTAATPARTARRRCSPRAASRRATARRCRGCCSSRGYAVWCQTYANGTRFDLGGRADLGLHPRPRRPAAAGAALRAHPAARLRALCRLTGFPALLPEWGYGFWKSRDVHEHQDDVMDDFDGFRRHGIPLDAIVIDSPWATQYNTWEFNPHQFPDAPGMVATMRADGVRTVVWVTPWVNLDSRDGQIPPQPESERLHARARRRTTRRRRRRGTSSRDADGEPFVAPVVDGDRIAGRLHQPGGRALVARVGQAGAGARGRGDQGRRRRWLLHPRRGAPRRRPHAAPRPRGSSAACTASACSARSTRSIPAAASCSGAAAGPASTRPGMTWGGDQASDFWSLRVLVVAALSAACSGFSNFSHDVGGYLGHRLVERCPPELLSAGCSSAASRR